jgi:hypothetical protein
MSGADSRAGQIPVSIICREWVALKWPAERQSRDQESSGECRQQRFAGSQ